MEVATHEVAVSGVCSGVGHSVGVSEDGTLGMAADHADRTICCDLHTRGVRNRVTRAVWDDRRIDHPCLAGLQYVFLFDSQIAGTYRCAVACGNHADLCCMIAVWLPLQTKAILPPCKGMVRRTPHGYRQMPSHLAVAGNVLIRGNRDWAIRDDVEHLSYADLLSDRLSGTHCHNNYTTDRNTGTKSRADNKLVSFR